MEEVSSFMKKVSSMMEEVSFVADQTQSMAPHTAFLPQQRACEREFGGSASNNVIGGTGGLASVPRSIKPWNDAHRGTDTNGTPLRPLAS